MPAARGPIDEPLSLSYYQIDDYLTCPRKYQYAHVLRVPLAPHHAIVAPVISGNRRRVRIRDRCISISSWTRNLVAATRRRNDESRRMQIGRLSRR